MTTRGAGRAQAAVRIAVKLGVLPCITEKTKCVDCGLQANAYDHRDYNKPLEVEPVCHGCNVRRGPALPCDTGRSCMERSNFYFPEQMLARLKRASKKLGLPVSELLRRAVDEYL